jgi:CheY-like chemotaxis protein
MTSEPVSNNPLHTSARLAISSDQNPLAHWPLRVLVVDDLRDAAESMAQLLRILGYDARIAFDGETAIAAACEMLPHVVLLDLGLPTLSGYHVAERLRQEVRLQTTCLIALSGYGQAEDIERAHRAGFDRHFLKPVDIATLQAVLQDIAQQQMHVPG